MDYAAIIAAIGVPLAAIAGAILKHLYDRSKADADADFAKRKLSMEECSSDDHRADQWAERMILALQEEMKSLQAQLTQLRSEHLNCERTTAELRTEIAVLRRQVAAQ